MTIPDNRFIHIPIEEATKIKNGATVMMNRYWTSRKKGHISVYVGGYGNKKRDLYPTYSPQCNVNKNIAESRGLKAVFIPVVYFEDKLKRNY
jgi:poly(3-hydroxyalkanoate) synthetase